MFTKRKVVIYCITAAMGSVVGKTYANPYGLGRIVAVSEASAK